MSPDFLPLPPFGQTAPVEACGPPEDASILCRLAYEQTESELVARSVDWLVAKPLTFIAILAVAWIVSRVLRRLIPRFVIRVTGQPIGDTSRARSVAVLLEGPAEGRRQARAEAVGAVLRSMVTATVWGIAVLMALGEVGIELGPLIAGAGVIGIAIGFGAQSLVRDFLSGIFMLAEDQFGVGDVVDLGEAVGVVEGISLRVTRVRDVNGNLWHVPNGEIHRVSNRSQAWARALLDIQVAYDTDIDWALAVIKRVADEMWTDQDYHRVKILEEPEVWGVESLDADGISLRLVVKTRPREQFDVARELRRRIKLAFDAEGIEIPFPQQTVWIRNGGKSVDA